METRHSVAFGEVPEAGPRASCCGRLRTRRESPVLLSAVSGKPRRPVPYRDESDQVSERATSPIGEHHCLGRRASRV
jgi:hypothetical protein